MNDEEEYAREYQRDMFRAHLLGGLYATIAWASLLAFAYWVFDLRLVIW